MNSYMKSWLIFWFALACVVGGTISCVVTVNANDNAHAYKTIEELVNKGSEPIAAGCAVWGTGNAGSTQRSVCETAVAHGKIQ